MTGHTSGPWALMASYPGVSTPRGDVALAVDDEILTALQPGSDGLARRWANARLIAAAPDLLAVVEAIAGNLVLCETGLGRMARAAIAKATGGAA